MVINTQWDLTKEIVIRVEKLHVAEGSFQHRSSAGEVQSRQRNGN